MKKAQSKIQVKKEHYSNKGYNDIFRFLSYQHQIESIISLNPKTILEIGIGNKLVSNQLKEMGYKVTTCDFDSKLKPDFVGDIRNLPFKNNEFDVVVAFEVLEHLPFGDFEKALSEMKRVSKKNCIISLPYPCFNFNLAVKFPLINKIFPNPIPSFSFRIPKFYQTHSFDGEHYWELGKKGYSKQEIRKHLRKYFKIIKEDSALMNPYHEFFILKKD